MRFVSALIVAAAFAWAPQAFAGVAQASPSSFTLAAEADVSAAPQPAWRALTQVGRWWNEEHTYSGNGRNLRLDARAGGCWCERWGDNQSIEHMHVVLVMEHEGVRTLRVVGGLGPLQEMAVSGVLTFTIAPQASGAKISMTYRVSGDAGLNLDQIAPLVDEVLMEQFGRLIRYTGTGSPD